MASRMFVDGAGLQSGSFLLGATNAGARLRLGGALPPRAMGRDSLRELGSLLKP